jgi:hypothetical protein
MFSCGVVGGPKKKHKNGQIEKVIGVFDRLVFFALVWRSLLFYDVRFWIFFGQIFEVF